MIANAGSYANSAGAVPKTSRNACCSACDPATRPRSLPHLCPPPAVDRCQSPTFAAVDRLAGSRPLENGRPGRRRDPSRTRRCHDRSLRPSVGGTYRPAGSGAIRAPTVHGIEQVRQPRRSGVRFAGRCQNWGMLRGRLDGSGRPDRRELFAESVRFGFTGRLSPVDTVVAQGCGVRGAGEAQIFKIRARGRHGTRGEATLTQTLAAPSRRCGVRRGMLSLDIPVNLCILSYLQRQSR